MSFLDDLERDLLDAAERRRDGRRAAGVARARERLGVRRIAAATLLCAGFATASAAATFAVLRGSVIPGPVARDVPPDQLPEPGTGRVSDLRAADPDPDAPPWTIRLSRSRTGLLCSTAGQVRDGRFGLVGLDGRFRAYADEVVDACGERQTGERSTLVGARIFAARAHDDVRTVVSGVGGPLLRAARLETTAVTRPLALGPDGTFVAVLPGYPEDRGVRLALRYRGGRVERHDLGTSRNVVPDPEGGRAWRVTETPRVSLARRRCVNFEPARAGRPRALSPSACGLTARGVPRAGGAFFAVRRIEPGTGSWRGQFRGDGLWGAQPARTAVWGGFADDVARIEVLVPGGERRVPALGDRHVFLAVLPGSVDPLDVVVRVVRRDGRVEQHRGDTRLVPPGGGS